MFRAALFEQLGEPRLEGAVTTDICGKKDSHALRLDKEAVETIRKARLHQKVATTIFFESNGGQRRPRQPFRRFVLRSPNRNSTLEISRPRSRHYQLLATIFQPRRTAIGLAYRRT